MQDVCVKDLTYVLAIHVVVEGEAVGGEGRHGAVGALGRHVERRGHQASLVPLQTRSGRLNVHVET